MFTTLWEQINSTAGAGLPLVALWHLRFFAEEHGNSSSGSRSLGGCVSHLRACVQALLSMTDALDPSMHPRQMLVAAWLIRPATTSATTTSPAPSSSSSSSGDSNVLIDATVFDLLQSGKEAIATTEVAASSSDHVAIGSDAKVYFNRSVRVASAVAQWLDTRVATVLQLALRTTR